MIRAATIAAVLAAAAPALADVAAAPTAPAAPAKKPRKPLPPYVPGPPDPAALAAAEDANLEPIGRSGGVVVAAIGPAIQIGIGMDEQATGTGGGFTFRIGHVANRDTMVLLELCGTVFPYKTTTGETKINQSVLLTLGGQTYVAPTLWLRAAPGFAAFTSRNRGAGGAVTRTELGVGFVGGAGVDLVRRKSVAFAIELLISGAYYFDGAVIGGGLGLSLGMY